MSTTDSFLRCPHCSELFRINMLFVDHNTSATSVKDYRTYCPECKENIFFSMADAVSEIEPTLHECEICGSTSLGTNKTICSTCEATVAKNNEPEPVDTDVPMWKQALQKFGMD